MSDFVIKNGTGDGNRAEVDSEHRLHVAAKTRTASSISTEKGLSFGFAVLDRTITGGHEHGVFRFKNEDPNYDYQVTRIFMAWNGGDTNHNRVIVGRAYKDSVAPTGHCLDNATYPQIGPGNLNLGSSRTAIGEYHIWNGASGLGMEMTSSGTLIQSVMGAQGTTVLDIDGTIDIPFGSSYFITLEAEETGKFSIIATGWFAPKGAE